LRPVAILPVKNLKRAKSRLSTVMSGEGRKKLVLRLFLHAGCVCQTAGFQVFCLTSDKTVAETSLRMGWRVLQDRFNDLNKALTSVLKRFSTVPLTIVLPDLPLLNRQSLETVSRLGRRHGCVICPDLKLSGTNVLYLGTASFFKPMFGKHSFIRHLNQLQKSYPVKVLVTLATAVDIDSPEDLLLLPRFSFSSPVHYEESCYKH